MEVAMFRSKHRVRVFAPSSGEVVTKQYPKDECDINNILNNYKKTGVINHLNTSEGRYLDLPSSMDFQDAIRLVHEANDAFAELPAVIRDRFNNSPEAFLRALPDPALRSFFEDAGVFERPAPSNGPGSVPVPGSGPIGAPVAAPASAPGVSPGATPDGRP